MLLAAVFTRCRIRYHPEKTRRGKSTGTNIVGFLSANGYIIRVKEGKMTIFFYFRPSPTVYIIRMKR